MRPQTKTEHLLFCSCEAEARYLTSDHSQDSDSGEHEDVSNLSGPYQFPSDSTQDSKLLRTQSQFDGDCMSAPSKKSEKELSSSVPYTCQQEPKEAKYNYNKQLQDHSLDGDDKVESGSPSDSCSVEIILNAESGNPVSSPDTVKLHGPVSPSSSSSIDVKMLGPVSLSGSPDGKLQGPVSSLCPTFDAKILGPDSSPGDSQSPVQNALSADELSDSDPQMILEDKKEPVHLLDELNCSSPEIRTTLSKESPDRSDHKAGCLDIVQEEQLEDGSDDFSCRVKLALMAEKLVEKWEGLKEVFRIPKKAPKVSTTDYWFLC